MQRSNLVAGYGILNVNDMLITVSLIMHSSGLYIDDWVEDIVQTNPLLISKIIGQTQETDEKSARLALREVVRFLCLCAQSDQVLTPSKRVDDVWHEFILFTRSYMAFCEQQLGQFVHHQPSQAPDKERAQYAHTLSVYASHFGPPAQEYWPSNVLKSQQAQPSQEVAPCGLCEN